MSIFTIPEGSYLEPSPPILSWRNVLRLSAFVAVAVFFAACVAAVKFDINKLFTGLPKVAGWVVKMFPPDFSEINLILQNAFQTLAMATVGTFFALVLASLIVPLAARNTSPHPIVYRAARGLLSMLRGTEMLIFALIFVAAVGFGPFTGVLAITFNMTGALGKLLTEVIEPADPGPIEAIRLTGASPTKTFRYAMIPDVWPNIVAVTLYIWEFNVRASTVLGIVGAGGIGQMLKDSIDLLNFPEMLTILGIILIMVITIDMLSSWLRRIVLNPSDTKRAPLSAPRRLNQGI